MFLVFFDEVWLGCRSVGLSRFGTPAGDVGQRCGCALRWQAGRRGAVTRPARPHSTLPPMTVVDLQMTLGGRQFLVHGLTSEVACLPAHASDRRWVLSLDENDQQPLIAVDDDSDSGEWVRNRLRFAAYIRAGNSCADPGDWRVIDSAGGGRPESCVAFFNRHNGCRVTSMVPGGASRFDCSRFEGAARRAWWSLRDLVRHTLIEQRRGAAKRRRAWRLVQESWVAWSNVASKCGAAPLRKARPYTMEESPEAQEDRLQQGWRNGRVLTYASVATVGLVCILARMVGLDKARGGCSRSAARAASSGLLVGLCDLAGSSGKMLSVDMSSSAEFDKRSGRRVV